MKRDEILDVMEEATKFAKAKGLQIVQGAFRKYDSQGQLVGCCPLTAVYFQMHPKAIKKLPALQDTNAQLEEVGELLKVSDHYIAGIWEGYDAAPRPPERFSGESRDEFWGRQAGYALYQRLNP